MRSSFGDNMELLYTLSDYIVEAYEFYRDYFSFVTSTHIANVLIYSAGLIWGIELIPQITKTYKSKDVSGISLAFFSMCLFAYAIYMIGNAILQQWNIVIAHIPSLIFNLVMVVLIVRYK
jgi:uncharacterized protein with PQ loop repeat